MRKLGTSGPEPSSEAVGTYSSAPHQTLRNRSSFRFTDNVSCSCSRRLGGIPGKSPALRVLLPHVRHGLGLGVPGLGLGAPDICHGVSPRNSSFSFMVLKRTVLPQAVILFRVFPGVHTHVGHDSLSDGPYRTADGQALRCLVCRPLAAGMSVCCVGLDMARISIPKV